MKFQKDTIIPALDLMLIIVVTFLIGIFSVRFIAEKGLGEKSYFPLHYVTTVKNVESLKQNLPFFAVILTKNEIQVSRIQGNLNLKSIIYRTPIEFSNDLKDDDVYVIYEKEKSKMLGDVIRGLSKTNSTVLIASGN